VALFLEPPLTEDSNPEASFSRPPLTEAELFDAMLCAPPLTELWSLEALFSKPPLIEPVTPSATFFSPPVIICGVFFMDVFGSHPRSSLGPPRLVGAGRPAPRQRRVLRTRSADHERARLSRRPLPASASCPTMTAGSPYGERALGLCCLSASCAGGRRISSRPVPLGAGRAVIGPIDHRRCSLRRVRARLDCDSTATRRTPIG
jgi:hypothetical protein